MAMGASGRSDASHGSSSGGGAGSSGHEAQPGRQRGMHAGSQWGRGGCGRTAPWRPSMAQLKLVARHAAMQAPAQEPAAAPHYWRRLCSSVAPCLGGLHALGAVCLRTGVLLTTCRCPAAPCCCSPSRLSAARRMRWLWPM